MDNEASPQVAVSPARVAALGGLNAVLRKGVNLDEAMEHLVMDGRDRALARLLLTTTLRRLGQITAIIKACLDRPLPKNAAVVEDILRLGAVQLLFLDMPPHAAVSTAVDLARAVGMGAFADMVNAVLRRIGRIGKGLVAEQDAARMNTPNWLWESWSAAHGSLACRAIATAHLQEPPLDITVRSDPATWAHTLNAEALPTGSLRTKNGGPIPAMPGFQLGSWWVQDMAAAIPARLFGALQGKRVVDLCAAPGGKTAQLCAMGAQVTAVDLSERRLATLRANLLRLGFMVNVVATDAALWRPSVALDGVLLDAPCTGTGTIRRHPDLAWRKTQKDLQNLIQVQQRLLTSAVLMLKPGGTLIYSTCSIQPEECASQIETLLSSGAKVRRKPIGIEEVGGLDELISSEGDLRTMPYHLAEKGGMDGFYAARLERI